MPPVSPMGDQPVYTTADDPRLPLLEPVLHAPWLQRVVPGAGLWPPVVFAAGTGVAVVAGAGTLATLFVMLALALDTAFGAALAHQSGPTVAAGLVWLAAGGAFSEPSHPGPRPWVRSLVATALWALAVWWYWLAMAAWPMVFSGLRRRPERPAWALWALLSFVAGAAALVAHFAWTAGVAQQQAFAPGTTLTWWDALAVAFDSRPRMPLGSYVTPGLPLRPSWLAMALTAAGLSFGVLPRWWRPAVLLTAAAVAAVGVVWPEWQAEVFRFGLWLLTPMAAVGLTWASRQVGPRRGAFVTCALGAVLVGEAAVLSARPLTGQDARGFRDRFVGELAGIMRPEGLVIAAEDTRIDSALAAWMATRGNVRRAAQDGRVGAAALAAGRTILAGPTAQQHLLLTGLEFSDGFTISDPAPLVMSVATAALRCVAVRSDRWSPLPGVEFTGRLGVDVPPRLSGELQVIIGDALPLAVRVETPDGRTVPVVSEALASGAGSGAAAPADYWLEGGSPDDSPRVVARVRLPAHPLRSALWSLRLGRRAPRILARLAGFDETARGRVCAAPVSRRVFFDETRVAAPVPLDDYDLFGRGWYGVERSAAARFRRTDADPVLLLRSAARTSVIVELDAEPSEATESAERRTDTGVGRVDARARSTTSEPATMAVTLRVNGVDMGTRPMAEGTARYSWSLPAGVWLAGTNELWWHVARERRPADAGENDRRTPAMRVMGVTVRRANASSEALRAYGTEISSISNSRVASRGMVGSRPAAP